MKKTITTTTAADLLKSDELFHAYDWVIDEPTGAVSRIVAISHNSEDYCTLHIRPFLGGTLGKQKTMMMKKSQTLDYLA